MKHEKDLLRTPLKHVRGLGSLHDGTHHWWMQRVTSLALVPLSIWMITSMLCGAMYASPDAVVQWFGHPLHAAAVIAMLVALFYHAKLGVQVIIEDYVNCPWAKTVSLMFNQWMCVALGVVSVLAVLKMHLQHSSVL